MLKNSCVRANILLIYIKLKYSNKRNDFALMNGLSFICTHYFRLCFYNKFTKVDFEINIHTQTNRKDKNND